MTRRSTVDRPSPRRAVGRARRHRSPHAAGACCAPRRARSPWVGRAGVRRVRRRARPLARRHRRPDPHPAVGRVPLLRHDRRRHRHRLGLRRHARPRPGRVLRPRRLRDGHVPLARAGARRRSCPSSCRSTATTTSCRWLWQPFEHLWFAVAAGACSSRCWWPALLGLAGVPPADPRPVLRPAHPGDRARLLAAPGRPAAAHGRHQRPHRLPDGLRAQQVRPGHQRRSSTTSPPWRCSSSCCSSRWQLVHSRYGRLLVATRDGEDRVRFLGYDPAVVKTVAFAVVGGHGRRWPGRWPRRSSASSPPTSSPCCRRS